MLGSNYEVALPWLEGWLRIDTPTEDELILSNILKMTCMNMIRLLMGYIRHYTQYSNYICLL